MSPSPPPSPNHPTPIPNTNTMTGSLMVGLVCCGIGVVLAWLLQDSYLKDFDDAPALLGGAGKSRQSGRCLAVWMCVRADVCVYMSSRCICMCACKDVFDRKLQWLKTV